MFSFRTTPLEDQLDRALMDGRVGCFCTQNCWDTARGRYLYDLFRQRGNLSALFMPQGAELTPGTNHIVFEVDQLKDLHAVVVEIQDAGSRYFNYTKDVFRLMECLNALGEASPALYVVDHINPAGRYVEGTMPVGPVEPHTPKVVHRHGLTLGELATLYYNEIGARFPLHIVSALAGAQARQILPWTIAPASDIPGMFTCEMYSGGGLWNNTTITPGIGTARPYRAGNRPRPARRSDASVYLHPGCRTIPGRALRGLADHAGTGSRVPLAPAHPPADALPFGTILAVRVHGRLPCQAGRSSPGDLPSGRHLFPGSA